MSGTNAALRSICRGLLLTGALLLLGVGCSITPPKVRAPFWPSWANNIEQGIAHHLAIAATAWDSLQATPLESPEHKRAEASYEYAVAEVLKGCGRRQLPKAWENGHVYDAKSSRYAFSFPLKVTEGQEIPAQSLDYLRVAETVKMGRMKATTEDGLGVPVVGQIARSEEIALKQPMLPLNGARLTLTAIIEFGPRPAEATKPRQATLRLINPLHESRPTIGGRKLPLAANYSVATRLALQDGFLKRFSLMGLLRPDMMAPACRLYLLEAYDPKRIPVVFVHGLLANPDNWYQTIQAINADPELRAHYQPWYFMYPSALDVPYSAQRLRQSLIQARNTLDPNHDDPGMNQMVLVGHSMGGLLCRLQTLDSGDTFWDACFTCRPGELKLSPESRKVLVSSLKFEKQPYVKRVIFIATPHRGSSIADIHLVYRLRKLISLPVDSVLLTKEVLTGNGDVLAPQIKKWGNYAFLSLGTLSPKHPYLQAMNSQPVSVPHHSIIGRIGYKPLEQSSDGVVPYKSSHLGTGTEVVVRHWHAMADEKDVVKEVVLRLRQHLREIR